MPRKSRPIEIPPEIRQALVMRKAGADSEQLLNDLIEVWGGTGNLARDIKVEFDKGKSGGMSRQRILDMLVRLITVNTTHDLNRSVVPQDMTDEELETTAAHYLERIQKQRAERESESELEAEGPGET